ncbi:secreted and transmembrane protein 1 [Elephas maximus indicus]|uniref:secreted and transmembrane protein 1 n=1 Tax=Elephas maximus indicus TaxID=99487 RepID=UPI002116200A|nr:secreted and transmembrane protein 1 [Elephas maximus indicus]
MVLSAFRLLPVSLSVSSCSRRFYCRRELLEPHTPGQKRCGRSDEDEGPLSPASILLPAMPASLPRVLQTLLLLAASPSVERGGAEALRQGLEHRHLAQQFPQRGGRAVGPASFSKGWDSPTCTSGVVSVSQGERAVMTCTICNDFFHVDVFLCVSHHDCQQVVTVKAPGNDSNGGWYLQVQGGVAELVIEKAQTTQTGEYRWYLEGRQWNSETTKLNVSDQNQGPATDGKGGGLTAPTVAMEALLMSSPIAAVSNIVVPTVVVLGLVLGTAGLITWCRCHGPQNHMQMRKLSTLDTHLST